MASSTTDFSIPAKVLEQHIAILGKTGSGKSYAAKGIAERILTEKGRVCIIDPTSGWWGLRSDASGKRAGFPINVFGGEHGDLPLGQNHGAELAEIIGTTDTSAVLDTRLMTVGERTRFFTDFAETLLRKNKGPLHVIIDEAHLFMPQGKVVTPQSGQMLHAGNNLISLGRGRGLRIMMISQRPAKLHKDSLTQAETLIALRLIAPQDTEAVRDWIYEWAGKSKGQDILSSLPSLPTGEGWIWSPGVGVLERMKFPRIKTYDSSRAPDGESANVVLATIDLPAIQARLGKLAKEAVENDPRRLRARIIELEKSKSATDPTVLQREFDREVQSATKSLQKKLAAMENSMKRFHAKVSGYFENGQAICESFRVETTDTETNVQTVTQSGPPQREVPRQVSRPPVARPVQSSNGHGTLPGPEQRILDAIAWLESLGIETPEQTAVAFLAGYTIGGGGFNNPRGSLRTKGLVEYLPGEQIRLTDGGRGAAHFPESALTNEELQRRVLERLPGPEQKILRVALDVFPDAISNNECAARAGYTNGGGGYNNPRGRLRTLGLIEYQSGGLRARDLLFPEGTS